MTAYLIVYLTLHDAEYRKEYQARVPAMVRKHGGEYLDRSRVVERIEGTIEPPEHVAILTFPSLENIHALFASEEYQPHLKARQQNATTQIIAFET